MFRNDEETLTEEAAQEMIQEGLNPIPWRRVDRLIVKLIFTFASLNLVMSLIIFLVLTNNI